MEGQFVISLDFEKIWGVLDNKSLTSYSQNLEKVDEVIDKLIDLGKTYNIKYTFATVGFLFFDNPNHLKSAIPDVIPEYHEKALNPYSHINQLQETTYNKSLYSGIDSLKKIKALNHEISSHTYSHYYCLEPGQSIDEFKHDLDLAIQTTKEFGVELKSIVFPRNQIKKTYLDICKSSGIIAYRGTEHHNIYKTKAYRDTQKISHRIMRLMDAYISISGPNTHSYKDLKLDGMVNIPSSYFLRPYSKTLKLFEPLKLKRVKNAMTHAAKNKQLYHIWWHPHNFGNFPEKNFETLEDIFKHYQVLRQTHNFESTTMEALANKII